MKINIKVTPTLEQIQQKFGRVEGSLQRGPNWDAISRYISTEVAGVFSSRGYGRWARLSEPYASWKAQHYPGKTILRLTDDYYRAATQLGSTKNYQQSTNDSLEFGVRDIEYARFHEEGTSRMPARPVFGSLAGSAQFAEGIGRLASQWVEEQIRAEIR